ncbi:MAG: hypothetical protein ACFB0B_12425 [Thermonemataceae bacterium]
MYAYRNRQDFNNSYEEDYSQAPDYSQLNNEEAERLFSLLGNTLVTKKLTASPILPIRIRVTKKMLSLSREQIIRIVLARAFQAHTNDPEFLAFIDTLPGGWKSSRSGDAFEGFLPEDEGTTIVFHVPMRYIEAFKAKTYEILELEKDEQGERAGKAARQQQYYALVEKDQSHITRITNILFERATGLKEIEKDDDDYEILRKTWLDLLDQVMVIYYESENHLASLSQPHARTYFTNQIETIQQSIETGYNYTGFQDYYQAYLTQWRIAQHLEQFSETEWQQQFTKGSETLSGSTILRL